MRQLLEAVAFAAGIAGIAACSIAGTTLFTGRLWVMGFDPSSLFLGGIALMAVACLAKLYQRDFSR